MIELQITLSRCFINILNGKCYWNWAECIVTMQPGVCHTGYLFIIVFSYKRPERNLFHTFGSLKPNVTKLILNEMTICQCDKNSFKLVSDKRGTTILSEHGYHQASKLALASSHFASGLHQTASAKLYRTHFSATWT